MNKKEYKRRCSICENHFERNNFYPGKLITVRDLVQDQCYFNEKRWLMNRMIHGWGVVCGLDVYEKDGKIFVKPGLAIDCCGREILVCEEKEVLLKPKESECHKEQEKQEQDENKFVICLEFHECKTEPVNLPSITCDMKEKCEFNRIRDSFKIYVIPESEVDIKEPCGNVCPLENKDKTVHNYLCEKLKKGCCECPEWPCLVLARITITPSEDPEYPTIKIDSCSRRKLVYSNPLLYDLINCYHGDLPHVIWINWKENGANLLWDEFTDTDGIYEKGVQVKFDRKMNENTINPNTFLFLVKMEDADTGNYRFDQVPGDISYDETESIATFKLTSEWLVDVYFGYSRIREKGGEFMVVLKGDFILSLEENGKAPKALDGNFIGGNLPSGNGTQGCDFVSWFSVGPKPEEKKAKKNR